MFLAVPCCAVTCQRLRCRAVVVPVGSTFARVVMLYRLPVCQQVTGRAVCVPCGFNTCALLRCFAVGVHCYGLVPVGSITTPCCSRFNMSLYSAKYIPSVCRLSISTNVLRPVKLPMRSRLFALYGCACLLSL